jgi:hypothetical protein
VTLEAASEQELREQELADAALLATREALARHALSTLPTFPLDGSVKTLGWGVAEWVEDWLLQPDGDDAGEPYRLTPEQLNFLLWFYAVDGRGNFTSRRAVLRRAKGWGKSPFLAAIALAELAGPVRFDYFDEDGEPVGKAHPAPWVIIAGVSETQTENTMAAVRAMVESSELPGELGWPMDAVGKTRIYTPGGGKLLPITASSSSQEGARPTFAIMDETHWWTESNGGHALARVIRRNLAKVNGRGIETTNAHEPGRDTVAEKSYLAYQAIKEGRSRAKGILYDSREAVGSIDLADRESLLTGLAQAYGDSFWVDLVRIAEEVWDPNTTPEDARRFYLNQIVAAADSWLAPHEYDANERPELAPLKKAQPQARPTVGRVRADTVALGFDGGRTDDSTALVAVRISDGAPFLLGLWEKPDGPAGNGWAVDHDAVRDAVAHAFATLDVVAFFADVAEWETDVDAWRDEYGEKLLAKATTRHAVAWDMRAHQADTVRAVEALHRAFIDHEVPHNGDLRLRRHVLNGRRRPNRWGVTFGKETRESPKKVDALAALLLARMGRSRINETGVLRRRGTGRLVGF